MPIATSKAPKIRPRWSESMRVASQAPISAPTMMPGRRRRTAAPSTPPRRWWARADRIAVGMIAPSEEPTASCTRLAESKASRLNTATNTGTRISPPPMPNMPAGMPATRPSATNRSPSASGDWISVSVIRA